MNPFKRIGAGIAAGFQRAGAAIQRVASRFIKPKPYTPSHMTAEEILKAPEPKSTIRNKIARQKEAEAYERALWAIRHGMENPDSTMAQRGQEKAIMYLNKSKELQGKGKLQDWSRQEAAEKFIRDPYSSAEGQKKLFDERLQRMNANLNLHLTEETYVTLKRILESDSFQKLAERKNAYGNSPILEELFGDIADAIEDNVDPERIEQTLEMFNLVGTSDFEAFSNIVRLGYEDYDLFREKVTSTFSKLNPDQVDFEKVFTNILKEFEL